MRRALGLVLVGLVLCISHMQVFASSVVSPAGNTIVPATITVTTTVEGGEVVFETPIVVDGYVAVYFNPGSEFEYNSGSYLHDGFPRSLRIRQYEPFPNTFEVRYNGDVILPATQILPSEVKVYEVTFDAGDSIQKFNESDNIYKWMTTTLSSSLFDASIQENARLVNALRVEVGVNEVNIDPALNKMAAVRAREIASFYDHTRPSGVSIGAYGVAENIQYFGDTDIITAYKENSADLVQLPLKIAEKSYTMWYHSPGHYRNMINAGHKYIGVGYAYSYPRIYGVQLFSDTPPSESVMSHFESPVGVTPSNELYFDEGSDFATQFQKIEKNVAWAMANPALRRIAYGVTAYANGRDRLGLKPAVPFPEGAIVEEVLVSVSDLQTAHTYQDVLAICRKEVVKLEPVNDWSNLKAMFVESVIGSEWVYFYFIGEENPPDWA